LWLLRASKIVLVLLIDSPRERLPHWSKQDYDQVAATLSLRLQRFEITVRIGSFQKLRSKMLRIFIHRAIPSLAVATAALALAPTGARSQQAAAPASQLPLTAPAADQTTSGGELEKVIVTGYILPRVGDGPQPVTTYDQDFIKKTGYQTTSDVLQTLPGAEGNWNPGVATGFGPSPGSASIALKGLPPNDTLVLVDGLRFPAYPFPLQTGEGAFSFVDLNSIPVSAIERIENS
jgi:outer membrane cobalamin receptor